MIRIEMERKTGAFGFTVRDEQGHLMQTDSSIENGGNEGGFRPMQLLLAALGSCSAIDMIQILQKQRQQIQQFHIKIEGEREKDKVPSLWKNIVVYFTLQGTLDKDKVEKAAALSMEKYCSVAETLRRGGTVITWQVAVTGAA